MKPYNLTKWLFILSIFSISMAFLESAVVVYLREIYYPQGFRFPLSPIDANIAITEIFREVATIIMLITVGFLSGKSFSSKFAWFLYSFAIWDIFYYIFLKLLLNWPETLMTYDILFLIPISWVGPVIAPILVSFTMIFLSLIILINESRDIHIKIKPIEWGILITGSIILIMAFTWDYSKYILENNNSSQAWPFFNIKLLQETAISYIPHHFNWALFFWGEFIILSSIVKLGYRLKRKS